MFPDIRAQSTHHLLSTVKTNRKLKELTDELKFSHDVSTLFKHQHNHEFIGWETKFHFSPLEELLTGRGNTHNINHRRGKRISNIKGIVKNHACYYYPQETQHSISLTSLTRQADAQRERSADCREYRNDTIKSKDSRFSIKSIQMDPSIDWTGRLNNTLNNINVGYISIRWEKPDNG